MSVQSPLVKGIDQPVKGIALICLALLLFSSHDTLSKYLSAFYPIVMVVWVRYVVHTLLMMVIFIPKNGLAVIRTKRPGMQLARAICLIGTSLFFTTGLRYIPLAEATAVNFLAPLLVTALSVLVLKEHVTRGQWAAVLTGFVGVMIVVRPGGSLFTPAILLPLASALCFGFYQLLTRMLSGIDSATTSNFLTGIFNTLIMSALVPFFWSTPTFTHGVLMLGLGTCGMLGHLLLTQSFRFAPPALLAPFSYGQILFAGMYGYLIFDHTPDIYGVVGISVICLSGLAVAWGQRKR
ncbi:MAG: rane protein [Pseudomonas sp.]|nr:rane protein [Pseudomonas sp.]